MSLRSARPWANASLSYTSPHGTDKPLMMQRQTLHTPLTMHGQTYLGHTQHTHHHTHVSPASTTCASTHAETATTTPISHLPRAPAHTETAITTPTSHLSPSICASMHTETEDTKACLQANTPTHTKLQTPLPQGVDPRIGATTGPAPGVHLTTSDWIARRHNQL